MGGSFLQFDAGSGSGGIELLPSFDYQLGWLAGLLAVIAGYALFPAVERVHRAQSALSRRAWLAGGALTMSVGIWGMHWVAMMGFELATSYTYDPWIGIAALVPAALGCAGAIQVLAARDRSPPRLMVGALVLATGICTMHFSAMQAMRGDVLIDYDLHGVTIALASGYGFAFVALYVNLLLARHWGEGLRARLVGSLVVGVTMLAVHFGGIAATQFRDNPAVVSTDTGGIPAFLIPAIATAVVLMVGLLWMGAIIDARLDAALEALRDSEARHRAAIDTMLDAHFIADSRAIIRFANAAAERMFGYTLAEMIGQPIGLLVAKSRSEESGQPGRADRLARPPVAPGQRAVFPDGARRKDGSVFPVEVCISDFEARGERHYSGVIRDLSRSWEADMQMRRLAAALEHAGEAIAILDADHVIRYVNPQYERQTGYTAEEVIGRKPGRNGANPESYRTLWETVERGEIWTGRIRSRRRDNSMYDEEITVAPVPDADGRMSAYVAILRDISQRLQAEQERMRLAEALEHASDSIEILDRHGQIIYVNRAYEQRTGRTLGEIRGARPEALLDFTFDESAYAEMRRTITTGQPWTGTLRCRDLEDRLLEEDVTVTPMRDSHGDICSYVVVKRDVTEKRALEAQLHRSQRLQSIGQLAGGIAHELQTPAQYLADNHRFLQETFASFQQLLARLSALAADGSVVPAESIAAALQGIEAAYLAEEIPKVLRQSAEGLQKITGIARGMRDLAHSGTSKVPIDLNRAIQSVIAIAASEWKYIAEVRSHFAEDLPPVRCTPGDLNLVILNLLVHATQAISAANANGARGKGTITIRTARVGDWVEIRVGDSGDGIAPEARQAIFDATSGAARTARDHALALVQDVVVKQHGGTIGLETETGVGSTFIIRLPIAQASAIATAACAPGSGVDRVASRR